MIDAHAHFYDATRPEGAPWPERDDPWYRKVLPAELRTLAEPHGITGVVAVEASPWIEDNQFLLDVATADPFVVGVVGALDPAQLGFRAHLERFAANPRYRGFRLRGQAADAFLARVDDPAYIAELRAVADRGLSLDLVAQTSRPGSAPPLLAATLKLAAHLPQLRMVVHHLPFVDAVDPATWRALHALPNLWAKVSRFPPGGAGDEAYDQIWETFGDDRLMYAGDWPNMARTAPYDALFTRLDAYALRRGPDAHAKFFRRNAIAAYRLALTQ
jgi:predicted TIM-barrel fold metal-dependent hydrolase